MIQGIRTKLLICWLMLSLACGQAQRLESKNGFTVLPQPEKGEMVATYAGGCFWALQECMLELKGVKKVVSGYSGGSTSYPDYEQVLGGKTGHAESVQVIYNPREISFAELTKAFFYAHDPTQVDRQGPDIGSDYRSIAFYRNEKEHNIIQNQINKLDSSGRFRSPVATEVRAFEVFYPAESSHQDYFRRNPIDFYIRKVSKPKVLKLRKAVPGLIKPQYLD